MRKILSPRGICNGMQNPYKAYYLPSNSLILNFRPRETLFFGDNFFRFGPIGSKFSHITFQPKSRFLSIWSVNKKSIIRYSSLPRNVNLIYYPDGGCTRRPAGLDGGAGQPRWVQPSLTPPTGRDPLGSRLSIVGRERDENGWGRGSRGFDARLANLCLDRNCY